MSVTDDSRATLTVERGLEVLRAFRSERVALGNAELVRRTGFSKAVVSRITSTLLVLGFLRRVAGTRQFELGTRALSLGQAYIENSPIASAAEPLLQSMADDLDVSTALAMRDHTDMLYIAYCKGARIATLRLGVGSVLPMALTSVGRCYLWACPEPGRRALMSAIRDKAGAQADQVEAGILRAFNDLDLRGFASSVFEYQRDVFGVAVPVLVGRDRTLMALNCGAVEPGVKLQKIRKNIVPRLKATAKELEAALADIEDVP